MRALAVILFAAACSRPSSPPVVELAEEPVRAAPVTDLDFRDVVLQGIADDLVREARFRGIEEVSGRNRVERLLRLEASIGKSETALQRVNYLTSLLLAHDASEWAKLRQRAEAELTGRNDPVARRVLDLLVRWRHKKSDIAFSYLSSNYTHFINRLEWEHRFHDFVAARPADAATWGWLLLRADAAAPRQEYGRADAETAYRYYLKRIGRGNAREARELFSVPGVQITAAP
ncbi:MAG TPA: hypothetical protein VEO54_26035 [Thermoanaerobaculia bacterium]|nr:hypothetical protein [Thermoanaerobaculia bacterium]